MAYCDYLHCEMCDCKAFYDSCFTDERYLEACKDKRVIVICKECAKTHKILVSALSAPMMPEPQDSLSYGLSDIGFSKVEHVK